MTAASVAVHSPLLLVLVGRQKACRRLVRRQAADQYRASRRRDDAIGHASEQIRSGRQTALTGSTDDDEIRADFDRDVEQLLPGSAAADECLHGYATTR